MAIRALFLSASASLKTGWKRRSGAIWRRPGTVRASVGSGEYAMAVRISAAVQRLQGSLANAESRPSTIGPITLDVKQTGERGAGNPHAAFDVAGAGNVARSR